MNSGLEPGLFCASPLCYSRSFLEEAAMHVAEPSAEMKESSLRTAITAAIGIIAARLSATLAVLPLLASRRAMAIACSIFIATSALAAGAVSTAGPARAAGDPQLCLTYDTSYCMAYAPSELSVNGGVYGVSPSSCNSSNDCSFTLVYEGSWNSQGVVGNEYEIKMTGTNYCVASTQVVGTFIGDSPCGANGTVWVFDNNGATGYYLVSRYVLNTYHPGSLAQSTVIVVNSPTDSRAVPYPTYERNTGGAFFGRWNT
jgi:hypothetical protein